MKPAKLSKGSCCGFVQVQTTNGSCILMERNSIVQKRKKEETEMESARAKRRQEIEAVVTAGLLAICAALIVALVAWGTMEYVDFMRR